MNSTNQKNVHKKRIVQVMLHDECIIHLEIISCENQINDLVELLSKHYCGKTIFIDKKEKI